jgi:HEPN domain-containing protein
MKRKSANWLKIARYDLRAAELAFSVGLHLTCVEKCHSSLEKLLKGLFMLTRYPDDIELMGDMLNEAYVQHILSETKRIFRWLEKKLLTN